MSDDYRAERIGTKPDAESPEWWASEREHCACQHHVDEHHQFNLGTPRYFAGGCMASGCVCSRFRPPQEVL
jgi:hypothetical protein